MADFALSLEFQNECLIVHLHINYGKYFTMSSNFHILDLERLLRGPHFDQ